MSYMYWVILALSIVTIATRGLPFLLGAKLAENARLQVVGRRLAAYIMMLLVIYQVNPVSFIKYPFGWPAVLSLLTVVAVHRLWHKPLMSMLLGTVIYILIQQYII